jgi:hypothetical protein
LFFLLIDRLYQYYRFGSFTNTYLSVFAIEQRHLNPALPANYPWELPFHVGFVGALFTPEKSIFLFDPLLILTILVSVIGWKYFRPNLKAYVIAAFVLLLAYICFYARYTVWSGDFAWGDRYVSTAAELVAFISVPLLLRHRKVLGKPVRVLGIVLIALSAVVQIASLAFWLPLEIYQQMAFGHRTFVIYLRFKNIVAFAMEKMGEWGLLSPEWIEDQWDYVHITSWYFLPFLLRRVGEAPRWVVDLAFAVWTAGLAATGWALWRLRRLLTSSAYVDEVAPELAVPTARRSSS